MGKSGYYFFFFFTIETSSHEIPVAGVCLTVSLSKDRRVDVADVVEGRYQILPNLDTYAIKRSRNRM